MTTTPQEPGDNPDLTSDPEEPNPPVPMEPDETENPN
jgi:hypothetical protein